MNYLGARTRRRQERRDRVFADHGALGERLEREGKDAFAALEPVIAPLAEKILDVVRVLPEDQRELFLRHALTTLALNALDSDSDPENFGHLIITGIDSKRPLIEGHGREHVGEAIARDALAHIHPETAISPAEPPEAIK